MSQADWKTHAAPLAVQPAEASPDTTCTVTIHNVHGWALDATMLRDVMTRCTREIDVAKVIDVYPQERSPQDAPAWKHPGYLEWTIRVLYRSGGAITIGAIQRHIGAATEFHS